MNIFEFHFEYEISSFRLVVILSIHAVHKKNGYERTKAKNFSLDETWFKKIGGSGTETSEFPLVGGEHETKIRQDSELEFSIVVTTQNTKSQYFFFGNFFISFVIKSCHKFSVQFRSLFVVYLKFPCDIEWRWYQTSTEASHLMDDQGEYNTKTIASEDKETTSISSIRTINLQNIFVFFFRSVDRRIHSLVEYIKWVNLRSGRVRR